MRTYRRLMMMVAVPVLSACGQGSSERTEAGESELAQARITGVCNDPLLSDDGNYLLNLDCKNNAIERLSLRTTPAERIVAAIGQAISRVGTRGDRYFFVDEKRDGWDLVVKGLAVPTMRTGVTPKFPANELAADRLPPLTKDHISFTADGAHVVFTAGRNGKFVMSARIDGAGPTAEASVLELEFASTSYGYARPWSSPDGKRVVLPKGNEWQVLELASPPTLGQKVTLNAPFTTSTIHWDSYDGATVVTWGVLEKDEVVASVDVATGSMKVLSSGLDQVFGLVVRGSSVWYSARRVDTSVIPAKVSYVLETVARDGTTPPKVLGTHDKPPAFRLSNDAKTVFYTAGSSSAQQLFKVPSDGSSEPSVMRTNVRVRAMEDVDNHLFVEFADLATGKDTAEVLDVTTMAPLQSFTFDDKGPHPVVLSGDGSTLYQSRACMLGDLDGKEIVRLTAPTNVVVPCQFSGVYGSFITIPNSAKVLFSRQQDDSMKRDLTLIGP